MIYCNNFAAIAFSQNSGSSSRSKHIDIKYLIVKEKVHESYISVDHVRTEHMLSDSLTKGLTPKVFQEHVTRMGLVESFDVLS